MPEGFRLSTMIAQHQGSLRGFDLGRLVHHMQLAQSDISLGGGLSPYFLQKVLLSPQASPIPVMLLLVFPGATPRPHVIFPSPSFRQLSHSEVGFLLVDIAHTKLPFPRRKTWLTLPPTGAQSCWDAQYNSTAVSQVEEDRIIYRKI